MAGKSKAHPGFKKAQSSIAKRTNPRTHKPYGEEKAGAILASAGRKASPAAKKSNPRLKRIRGA